MIPSEADLTPFTAGQVAILEMGVHKPSYIAFASAPDDDEYEFLIKRSNSNGLSNAIFDPHISKNIMLKDIVGRGFPVENYKGHDLVFTAQGTGLAPLRSALRHIFKSRKDYGRLVVLYGVRTLDDTCFIDEMNELWIEHGVELRQVISQPTDSDWSGPTGYVQSLLDNLIPELNNPIALVCGSQDMISQTKERLLNLGFSNDKILTNY